VLALVWWHRVHTEPSSAITTSEPVDAWLESCSESCRLGQRNRPYPTLTSGFAGDSPGHSGGVQTVRQYRQARLIDDLHLVVRPVLLGTGEPLSQGIDLRALGYACRRHVADERTMHVFLRRTT